MTPTVSITPTVSMTPTVSVTPTVSMTPTVSITPTVSMTPTVSVTPTVSMTPTVSITPTVSVSSTTTQTPTQTSSQTPTSSSSPTSSITSTPTPTTTQTLSITSTPTPTSTLSTSKTPTSSVIPLIDSISTGGYVNTPSNPSSVAGIAIGSCLGGMAIVGLYMKMRRQVRKRNTPVSNWAPHGKLHTNHMSGLTTEISYNPNIEKWRQTSNPTIVQNASIRRIEPTSTKKTFEPIIIS